MRDRELILIEMEQLLNLLFASRRNDGLWVWQEKPYSTAISGFCKDATAVIPAQELRCHVINVWMKKRSRLLSNYDRRNVLELLNANLPLLN